MSLALELMMRDCEIGESHKGLILHQQHMITMQHPPKGREPDTPQCADELSLVIVLCRLTAVQHLSGWVKPVCWFYLCIFPCHLLVHMYAHHLMRYRPIHHYPESRAEYFRRQRKHYKKLLSNCAPLYRSNILENIEALWFDPTGLGWLILKLTKHISVLCCVRPSPIENKVIWNIHMLSSSITFILFQMNHYIK